MNRLPRIDEAALTQTSPCKIERPEILHLLLAIADAEHHGFTHTAEALRRELRRLTPAVGITNL